MPLIAGATGSILPTGTGAHPAPRRPRLARVASETLGATALEALRSSILSGRFAGGERLVEATLAQEMGISRGPLREAMALLEKDGLILSVPRRGKYVIEFSTKVVDELYGLRKVLEVHAVELLIAGSTASSDRSLERAWRQVSEAADAGDPLRVAVTDLAFHDTLYRLTCDGLLMRVWNESVAGRLRMLVNTTTRTLHPMAVEVSNHQMILDAVRARDVETARQHVVQHVEDAWLRVRESVAASQAQTQA
ncbi:MAG TPA: GntR family transcriptional regulator [Candidatus Dormibacteraeota bacterium]